MTATFKKRLAISRRVKNSIRQGHALTGCYPLSIIMCDGGAVCTDCARREWRKIAHDTVKGWETGWRAAGVDVLWDGGNRCDHCGICLDAYPSKAERGGA